MSLINLNSKFKNKGNSMFKKLTWSFLLVSSISIFSVSAETLETLCKLNTSKNKCSTVTHFLNTPAEFESKFEEYEACKNAKFQLYKAEQNCAFDNYIDKVNKDFDVYKAKINKVWDRPTFSTNKSWVSYSDSLDTKREVDFENNIIRVTTINGNKSTLDSLKDKIISTSSLSIGKAQQDDPYSSKIIKAVKPKKLSNDSLLPLADTKNQIEVEKNALLKNIKTINSVDSKGNKITTVEAKFPASWINRKEQRFAESIQTQAERYKLEAALIFAVIKTESAFIPTAVSHIPAFGLMQVVPTSAGFDVTEYLEGKQRKLSKDYLFSPEKNIEAGSTYLYLLQSRYFKGITNRNSLKYCMIAAYNGGMGPIYNIFGNGSKKAAIKKINALSSEQVFQRILSQHKAEETRNYLSRVTTAEKFYKK